MKPKRSITFAAARGSVTFGTGENGFVFNTISGSSVPAVTVFTTQAPEQHGAYRENALLEPRVLVFSGYVRGSDGAADNRVSMDKNLKVMASVIGQVKEDMAITYTNTAGAYTAYGTVSAEVTTEARQNVLGIHYTPVTITVTCCRPFWYAPQESVGKLRFNARGLKFPFKLPTTFGVGGYRLSIDNESAVPLPIKLEITGPAALPTILNATTGKQLSIAKPLLTGEKLLIDTDPDNISVTHVDLYGAQQNALGYVDATTDPDTFEFLQLAPGRNLLVYSSGDDTQNAQVIVKWRLAWVGV